MNISGKYILVLKRKWSYSLPFFEKSLLFQLNRLRQNPTAVEGTSVITGPNCKKGRPICDHIILDPSVVMVLSVITFGPQCNKGRICKSYLYTQTGGNNTSNKLWPIRGKKCNIMWPAESNRHPCHLTLSSWLSRHCQTVFCNYCALTRVIFVVIMLKFLRCLNSFDHHFLKPYNLYLAGAFALLDFTNV